jgi:hypothetical protein
MRLWPQSWLRALLLLAVCLQQPSSSPTRTVKRKAHFSSSRYSRLPRALPAVNASAPFLLPEGYAQNVIASQPQFPDLPDMHTLNENGPQAGRFLYRTHEVGSNGAVSVTDLLTGETTVLVQRAEWSRLDGIVWMPWGTLLIAEERAGGLVYETTFGCGDCASCHWPQVARRNAIRPTGEPLFDQRN